MITHFSPANAMSFLNSNTMCITSDNLYTNAHKAHPCEAQPRHQDEVQTSTCQSILPLLTSCRKRCVGSSSSQQSVGSVLTLLLLLLQCKHLNSSPLGCLMFHLVLGRLLISSIEWTLSMSMVGPSYRGMKHVLSAKWRPMVACHGDIACISCRST